MKDKKLNCGIYKIENLINGHCYIGQTIHIDRRKRDHFRELQNGVHDNIYLQNSYNKYGGENFEFKIIVYCEPDQLTYYEQKIVDLYNPEYNIKKTCVTSMQGVKLSKEACEKISKALTGEGHPNFGKKESDEVKKKISDSIKGENHPNFGKPMPQEQKDAIGNANRGHIASEETKRKMSIAGVMDKETVILVKKLLDEGMYIRNIAKEIGVCTHVVLKVKQGWYKKFYDI
jgi:group I intron endonuclease